VNTRYADLKDIEQFINAQLIPTELQRAVSSVPS
jgi:hypothetical protein